MGLKEVLRQIKGDDPSKDDGPASLYDKAQKHLLKKLGKLLPQEVEAAAKRTIAELNAAVAAVKKPGVSVTNSVGGLVGLMLELPMPEVGERFDISIIGAWRSNKVRKSLTKCLDNIPVVLLYLRMGSPSGTWRQGYRDL